MEDARDEPVLTPRAKKKLGLTHGWARFAGFALFCVVLLVLARNGIQAAHALHWFHEGLISHPRWIGTLTGLVIGSCWIVIVNGILGWLALGYAGQLERIGILERPEPRDITHALRAQHHFWRMQGIFIIIGIVLIVLAIIAVFAVVATVQR